MKEIHLNFLSKDLTNLPLGKSLISDKRLCKLLEEKICWFHQSYLSYMDINCYRSKEKPLSHVLVKFRVQGVEDLELVTEMEFDEYYRLSEIIECYGVFYKNKEMGWQHGIIVAEDKSSQRAYDFVLSILPTNTELGKAFTIRAIDTYQSYEHKFEE